MQIVILDQQLQYLLTLLLYQNHREVY